MLQLENVVKTFGPKTAVNGLSLAVHAGEVVAVLGPNGAGKTTTVEMCEGFQKPDSGTVRVFGMDPVENSDHVRSRIGVMLQGGGAYPGVRVGEMLRLVASYSEKPLDVDWLLRTVGLSEHIKTPYRRLSGGQQQRLSLACALVGRPELVFLDEPTAGLDAQSRLAVWDLVSALRRDGVAVVLTTHLMDEAEALADHVYIIDRGSLVASGTPEEMTSGNATIEVPNSDPSQASASVSGSDTSEVSSSATPTPSPHHITVATASPVDLARWSASMGSDSVSITDTDRERVYAVEASTLTPTLIAQITAALAEQDVLLRSLDVDRQSLEDVFLSVTGREIR